MKILTISNLYPPHSIGGYEERCKNVMDALASKGHSIHVLTSNFHNKEVKEEETNISRTLKLSGYLDRPWLPATKQWRIEKHNQNELHKTISAINPDVIHVWNLGGINKSIIKTLKETGKTIVYDVSDHWIAQSLKHDAWIHFWSKPCIRAFRKLIHPIIPVSTLDEIYFENSYFCSDYMKKESQKAGYSFGETQVINCGVETETYRRKENYSAPKKFLWVGRLSQDKDPETVIRGLNLFKSQNPESAITLDIYGKGDSAYVEKIKQLVSDLNLGTSVEIKSATHSEMKQIYSQYDALLFSSNWGEPFALTPIEAMSSGLPVIMTEDGGQKELAKNRENCLTFAAGSPEKLCDAIYHFFQLEDHGETMAKQAMEYAKNALDIKTIVSQIESFLLRALNKHTISPL